MTAWFGIEKNVRKVMECTFSFKELKKKRKPPVLII